MKKILFILLYLVAIVGCNYAQPEVKTLVNDANAEKRNVTAFTGVEVTNAITLYLSQGNEDAVAISCSNASDNRKISTKVINGVLKISIENSGWSWSNTKAKAYVSIKNLESLVVSGASNCKINEMLQVKKMKLIVKGASNFKGSIKAEDIDIKASGASNVNITGSSNNATVEASGASSIKSLNFETTNCNAQASGASSIHIGVKQKLKAEASGASSIKYKGDGVIVSANETGASSIKKVD